MNIYSFTSSFPMWILFISALFFFYPGTRVPYWEDRLPSSRPLQNPEEPGQGQVKTPKTILPLQSCLFPNSAHACVVNFGPFSRLLRELILTDFA